MHRRFLLLLLLIVLAGSLMPHQARAQQPSPIDTFKIANMKAKAGDTVAVKLFVVNDSAGLAAIQAFVKIDTSKLEYVGDWDSITTPVRFYSRSNLIERGLIDSLFMSSFGIGTPLNVVTDMNNSDLHDTVFFNIFAAGDAAEIPKGRGNILQFFVRVKPTLPLGTIIPLRLFNPDQEIGAPYEYRSCEYSDKDGLIDIRPPTLVAGSITVDTTTTPGPGPTNTPPEIYPISPSTYTVQPGQAVSFAVSAHDVDTPQPITLTATNRPTGATFGTGGSVTGAGYAAGTFNWTPTQAQSNLQYSIVFTCKDDSNYTATPRTVTINVGSYIPPPPEEDLLYTASSKSYKAYSGGVPGLTNISIPINLSLVNASTSVYGVQFDFVYQTSVIAIDSIVPTERLTDFTIYDNLGATPGRLRVVAFGMHNQTMQPGTISGTAIFNFWVSVKSAAAIGESHLGFENAWEAISSSSTVPSVKLNFDTTGVFIVDQFGDVNGDGRVDVADAVVVVGSIIGTVQLTYRQFHAADLDYSAAVDVIDLVAIVNSIFGGTAPSGPGWNGPEATIALGSEAGMVSSGNVIEINADLPTDIAGLQVEVSYDPSKMQFMIPRRTELSKDLNLQYRDNGSGKMVLLLYPTNTWSSRIEAGAGTVIRLPLINSSGIVQLSDNIHITKAVLSDRNAVSIPVKGLSRGNLPTDFTLEQNYPNPFNPETVIEFTVTPGSAFKPAKLVIYNLLGEEVSTLVDNNLAAGKHSYRWAGTDDHDRQVASGVYFYRLTVGDKAQTKKMVLLK